MRSTSITYFIGVLFLIVSLSRNLEAQQFVNPGLEGPVGSLTSFIPDGWQNVPFTDTNCLATRTGFDTPDLNYITGPSPQIGNMGNPHSGNTFVSGAHMNSTANNIFQEGIMQTVDGFTIGNCYTVNFYQTIVKQNPNALDSSGSWAVYIDSSLIRVTTPSFSTQPFNSTSLTWEFKSVPFTATATQHTFKFLPLDDDTILDYREDAGIRMGIDSVFILNDIIDFDLGNDTTLCMGESLLLNPAINDASVTYLWQDNSTDSNFNVTQEGTYFVTVTNACEAFSDTIVVNFHPYDSPVISLGNDTSLCQSDSLVLNATFEDTTALYLWQDNYTDPLFTVSQTGNYQVVVTNICGSSSSSIFVDFGGCCNLLIPNTFTPDKDNLNDSFSILSDCSFLEYRLTIFNRWGEKLFETENPAIAWDGTNNKKFLPSESYTYVIKYSFEENNIKTKTGLINLLR